MNTTSNIARTLTAPDDRDWPSQDKLDRDFNAMMTGDAYFNRFDICAAHSQIECDYNVGGMLRERESNVRRNESTGVQLARLGYHDPRRNEGYNNLNENAKAIYRALERKYKFV